MSLTDWFRGIGGKRSPSVLLMDGGVSTHLEDLIAPATFSHRHLWSSSLLLDKGGCDTILQGHKDWLHAGVNIITTVTYQCHYGLVGGDGGADTSLGAVSTTRNDDGREDENAATHQFNTVTTTTSNKKDSNILRIDEIIGRGVALARRAVQEFNSSVRRPKEPFQTFVVASTGPYGAAMADGSEYTGKYPPSVTREKLKDFHRRKASALLATRPDGIAIETIPNLEEVEVICEVMKELRQNQKNGMDDPSFHFCCCWISLACQNDHELNDGHLVNDAIDAIQRYDPDCEWISAIGINCCDSAYVPKLAELLATSEALVMQQKPRPTRGIIVYPNSGESWDADNGDWKDGTGTTDLEFADRLMDAISIVHQVWKSATETRRKMIEAGDDGDEDDGDRNTHKQSKQQQQQQQQQQQSHPSMPPPRIVLGGCCRTNPATIALLRDRIDGWDAQNLWSSP